MYQIKEAKTTILMKLSIAKFNTRFKGSIKLLRNNLGFSNRSINTTQGLRLYLKPFRISSISILPENIRKQTFLGCTEKDQ